MARRYSRRAIIVGAPLAVAAAGGAAAWFGVRGSTPTQEPQLVGGVTVDPSAPADPLALRFTQTTLDGLEFRDFAPGEAIDWTAGAFFMDVETGTVQGIRAAGAASYHPVAAGRYVFVETDHRGLGFGVLVDRESREAWSWSDGATLWEGDAPFLVLPPYRSTHLQFERPLQRGGSAHMVVGPDLQTVVVAGPAKPLQTLASFALHPETGESYVVFTPN